MRNAFRTIGAVVLAVLACVSRAQARDLTFDQRVEAQRAIEQVYYRHQIGATKPFDQAVPRAVLEAKVRKYLEQTAALDAFWKTRVTDLMLQRELERMAGSSRAPDRLREIFSALGNDPFLIKECLARPILVDRLTRNFYAFDTSIHAGARRRAEALHTRLASGALDLSKERRDRTVVELVVGDARAEGPQEAARPTDLAGAHRNLQRSLSADEFQKERAQLPETPGRVGSIEEDRNAFAIRVVLDESSGKAQVASYTVPKTSWDAWWATARQGLRDRNIAAVASSAGALPVVGSDASAASAPCAQDDTWDNGSLDDVPNWYGQSGVWTGSVMVVWGGKAANTGGRYDPATDTWTAISTEGAPSDRSRFTAVWTGSRMVVWGGLRGGPYSFSYLDTGGRYDPSTDTWTAMSVEGAPSARYGHTAVWTGSLMVVWGGHDVSTLNTGGRYDPATDTWTPTSTAGAPVGWGHTAIWTGSLMVIWGGGEYSDSGARYDPATDTWTPTSTAGAPSGRSWHTAVWTGRVMVVWGGLRAEPGGISQLDTGGQYDPATDSWTPTSTAGTPLGRSQHTAVWTGSEMVIWGGMHIVEGDMRAVDTGGRYDPATDTWTATSTAGAPSGRYDHVAVWTGSLMVVWGASSNTGGRYDPATDSWTPTSIGGAPSGRSYHTAVWTGSLMVVWGGADTISYTNTGGRYDPATDSWTVTSTVGAPSARVNQTAVWTGSVMVVWGGYDSSVQNTGGRYDPATDTWTATSTVGAPSSRAGHTAVWTGSLMIVWGGWNDSSRFDTGGRYDPATDTWTTTSTVGAPSSRSNHTAVWTGNLMIVWGGGDLFMLETGGRYDPENDTWSPMSITETTPSGRFDHAAVWTGSLMLIWGGMDRYYTLPEIGGRYDPASDTWSVISTEGAPSPRVGSAASWTGNRMLVWGGSDLNLTGFSTGGRYDPETDTWTPISTAGAPSGVYGSTGIWTGEMMIVWGGADFNTGGRYISADTRDQDGDGYEVCDGDCDDTNPDVHPDAVEVCDGIDYDCDGVAGTDDDGDGVCSTEDRCPATRPTPTVVIGNCDSGVNNHLSTQGCSFGDGIAACQAGARNHGRFVSCVAHLVNAWRGSGLITGRDGSRITRCAAQSRP